MRLQRNTRGQEEDSVDRRVSIFVRSRKEGDDRFREALVSTGQDPFDLAHTPPIDQAEPLGRGNPVQRANH